MPVKKQDFLKAALKKGYQQVSRRDHIYLRYVDENGKIIDAVHTKVSHGGGKNAVSPIAIDCIRQQSIAIAPPGTRNPPS